MDRNHFFVLIFGVGSVLGGLVSSAVKRRLDDRLEGQRKFFARISLENRKRMHELKDILRGRPGKHVTIFRAEDVYLLR